jgi:hypothetical protein
MRVSWIIRYFCPILINCPISNFIGIRSSFLDLFNIDGRRDRQTDRNCEPKNIIFPIFRWGRAKTEQFREINFTNRFVQFCLQYTPIDLFLGYSITISWRRYIYVATMLQTCIQEVFGSNLDWDTWHVSYLWFSVVLLSFGIIPRLGHDRFLPNHFQFIIHRSPHQPRLCSPDTNSVVK